MDNIDVTTTVSDEAIEIAIETFEKNAGLGIPCEEYVYHDALEFAAHDAFVHDGYKYEGHMDEDPTYNAYYYIVSAAIYELDQKLLKENRK